MTANHYIVRVAVRIAVVLAVIIALGPSVLTQSDHFARLPADLLDVQPPASRVSGSPGSMTVRQRPCTPRPAAQMRRRIVDLAVQEWGFFGFPVRDEAAVAALEAARAAASSADTDQPGRRFRFARLDPAEAARVASSVAGYWAVTPEAVMMVNRQNAAWNEADGPGRADPWSAAFVSWIMCEAGLATHERFQRAIAHHSYIDQAIRARQGNAPQAAYRAYDAGEAAIAPGDLLCAARRPVYRSLAERRRQMGEGARTHCDVVVKINDAADRILAIGGNVGRSVSLKVLRGFRGKSAHLQAASLDEGRPVFAHLKLQGAPIESHAFDASPTITALNCGDMSAWPRVARLLPQQPVTVVATRC